MNYYDDKSLIVYSDMESAMVREKIVHGIN